MHFSVRETFLKKENLWIKMIESHDWKHTQENFPNKVYCGGLELERLCSYTYWCRLYDKVRRRIANNIVNSLRIIKKEFLMFSLIFALFKRKKCAVKVGGINKV